jgi:hypothetical protein
MDRKFCILVYSNFSQSSIDLIDYILSLPIDFPTIAGITMFNVDSAEAKKSCIQNGVEHVPCLLIQYYNGSKQKLEKENIYSWISQMLTSLRIETPTAPTASDGGKTHLPQPTQPTQPEKIDFEKTDSPPKTEGRKKDITSMALEMQKSRESDLAELKEKQKPI